MMLSEKWRPLIVTLSVIAAIFTALFVLAGQPLPLIP